MRTNVQYKKGFTLIELLVVITIIAILAAILFPVFSKAREKGRQANCISNQKQMALAVIMYMNEHETTLPGENWTRDIGMEGSKMLKCPSSSLDDSDCDYIFNILISGKKMAAISCDPTEMWLTADGVTGEVDSLANGDWRHDGKIIMSWLDGHVALGEGTMMDYYRKVENITADAITLNASGVMGEWFSGVPVISISPDGDLYITEPDGVYNPQKQRIAYISDLPAGYETYKIAFDRNSNQVAIMGRVGNPDGYIFTTTREKLRKATVSNPLTVTMSACVVYAEGDCVWDIKPTDDGSILYQAGDYVNNYISTVNLETGKKFAILRTGQASTEYALSMDMLVFAEGLDSADGGEGAIYLGQWSAMVKKAKELNRALDRNEAISLGLVKQVAKGYLNSDGTVMQMNMNQNGDVYCSTKNYSSMDTKSFLIRGCALYSVFKGKRALVTPTDGTRITYTFTPDPARDDMLGMPAFFSGKNMLIGYMKDDYVTYTFKQYRGE